MSRRRDRRGAALLAALGALALVGALATAGLSLATGPARRAAAAVAQAEAARLAEAAVHRAVAALADPGERAALPRDGTVLETRFLGARLLLAAQDLAGLVDLNDAPPEVVARLLAATGADPAAAGRIARTLAAARAARRASGPNRRAFREPEDALEAVAAADRPALAAALPFAAVLSERPTVDRWTAPAPALAAATGAPLAAAQAHVAERAALGRRAPPPPFPTDLLSDDGGGRRVRLTATAETDAGGRATVEAVVEADPGPPPRWRVLAWR